MATKPGGFTAEQIIQMQAILRKNGRRFSNKAKYLNRYPYRGQSAVTEEEAGPGASQSMGSGGFLFLFSTVGS